MRRRKKNKKKKRRGRRRRKKNKKKRKKKKRKKKKRNNNNNNNNKSFPLADTSPKELLDQLQWYDFRSRAIHSVLLRRSWLRYSISIERYQKP